MPKVEIKSVILYNLRRVQPETLRRIADAKDGEFVGVNPSEFEAFQQLVIYVPDMLSELRRMEGNRAPKAKEAKEGEE